MTDYDSRILKHETNVWWGVTSPKLDELRFEIEVGLNGKQLKKALKKQYKASIFGNYNMIEVLYDDIYMAIVDPVRKICFFCGANSHHIANIKTVLKEHSFKFYGQTHEFY